MNLCNLKLRVTIGSRSAAVIATAFFPWVKQFQLSKRPRSCCSNCCGEAAMRKTLKGVCARELLKAFFSNTAIQYFVKISRYYETVLTFYK